MPRMRRATALALSALVFAAAACGGDSENTENSEGGERQEAPLRDEGQDPAQSPAPTPGDREVEGAEGG